MLLFSVSRERLPPLPWPLAAVISYLVFACFLLTLPAFAQTGTLPTGLNLSDSQLIARGSTLFAQSCSVGYCHGVAGKAGRGPRLRGREWDKNYLFKVTSEGIPNSSMPAWKGRLTELEIGAVVAYVLTLSKLTSDSPEAPVPAAPVASEPEGASEASSTKLESSPADGSLLGDAEKGKALFFDSSNDWHCAACHRVGGAGASVGPELSGVKSKTVKDLFIDIVIPSARLSPDRPFLSITTKSGEQIQAVKSEESPSHIRLYDIGSLPAVLRNLPKDQIQKLDIQSRSAMPAKYGEMYTVKQLLDIIAFLKAGGSGPAQAVSLNDLR
jgi:putative heme-binding domain-containing protein